MDAPEIEVAVEAAVCDATRVLNGAPTGHHQGAHAIQGTRESSDGIADGNSGVKPKSESTSANNLDTTAMRIKSKEIREVRIKVSNVALTSWIHGVCQFATAYGTVIETVMQCSTRAEMIVPLKWMCVALSTTGIVRYGAAAQSPLGRP